MFFQGQHLTAFALIMDFEKLLPEDEGKHIYCGEDLFSVQ